MSQSLWRVMFLPERYQRLTLSLNEVADQIGVKPKTILNSRASGSPEFKGKGVLGNGDRP